MPPGVKRTPRAVSQVTAAGRSSIHRPTWLSGGSWPRGPPAPPPARVDRVHEVALGRERPAPRLEDVLVDVVALVAIGALRLEPQRVGPHPAPARPVGA